MVYKAAGLRQMNRHRAPAVSKQYKVMHHGPRAAGLRRYGIRYARQEITTAVNRKNAWCRFEFAAAIQQFHFDSNGIRAFSFPAPIS